MKRSYLTRLMTSYLCLLLMVGGLILPLGGCEQTTKDNLLAGVQASTVGLVTALLDAFFSSIATGATDAAAGATGGATSQPTV